MRSVGDVLLRWTGKQAPSEEEQRHTSSMGAASGAESYPLALFLVLALTPVIELRGVAMVVGIMLATQLLLAKRVDLAILYHGVTSQAFGPAAIRNASIGFAQCVRPGGRPTSEHCLSLFHFTPAVSSLIFAFPALTALALGPLVALIRVFYPEHRNGVNKDNLFQLWWFFVRHPVAIQGEGPSNGDGLAAMGGSESLIYPLTHRHLARGPLDHPYWLTPGWSPRVHLRDFFHGACSKPSSLEDPNA